MDSFGEPVYAESRARWDHGWRGVGRGFRSLTGREVEILFWAHLGWNIFIDILGQGWPGWQVNLAVWAQWITFKLNSCGNIETIWESCSGVWLPLLGTDDLRLNLPGYGTSMRTESSSGELSEVANCLDKASDSGPVGYRNIKACRELTHLPWWEFNLFAVYT